MGRVSVSNLKKNDTVVFDLFLHKVLKYYMGRYYFNAHARQEILLKCQSEIERFYYQFTVCEAELVNPHCRETGRLLPHHLHIDESLTAVSDLFQTHTQKHKCNFVYFMCTQVLAITVHITQIHVEDQNYISRAITANDLITTISKGKLQAACALPSP